MGIPVIMASNKALPVTLRVRPTTLSNSASREPSKRMASVRASISTSILFYLDSAILEEI
jgi:hypothetical protein